MTAAYDDPDITPIDYRTDHLHPLVLRALMIPCPYPPCQASV